MNLSNHRKEIDQIDEQISKLLNKRFLVVKEIKELKKSEKIVVADEKREQIVIDKNIVWIDPEFYDQFKSIYLNIFKNSKEYQKK